MRDDLFVLPSRLREIFISYKFNYNMNFKSFMLQFKKKSTTSTMYFKSSELLSFCLLFTPLKFMEL